jgi:hypothetical protein
MSTTNKKRARDLHSSVAAAPSAFAAAVAATPPSAPPVRRLMSISTSAERKAYPICTGVFDYFPDALPEVAKISFTGNQKHNPGEPLHWARGKSMDHADCVARHLIERGGFDPEGNRHSAQMVWRALAILQEELEAEKGLSTPRGATDLPPR